MDEEWILSTPAAMKRVVWRIATRRCSTLNVDDSQTRKQRVSDASAFRGQLTRLLRALMGSFMICFQQHFERAVFVPSRGEKIRPRFLTP